MPFELGEVVETKKDGNDSGDPYRARIVLFCPERYRATTSDKAEEVCFISFSFFVAVSFPEAEEDGAETDERFPIGSSRPSKVRRVDFAPLRKLNGWVTTLAKRIFDSFFGEAEEKEGGGDCVGGRKTSIGKSKGIP